MKTRFRMLLVAAVTAAVMLVPTTANASYLGNTSTTYKYLYQCTNYSCPTWWVSSGSLVAYGHTYTNSSEAIVKGYGMCLYHKYYLFANSTATRWTVRCR